MHTFWNKEISRKKIGLMKANTEKGSEKMNKREMNENEKTAPNGSLYMGVDGSKNTTEEYE
jgi:hypothetical protein